MFHSFNFFECLVQFGGPDWGNQETISQESTETKIESTSTRLNVISTTILIIIIYSKTETLQLTN